MSRPEFENQTMISAVSSKKIKRIMGEANTPIPAGTRERIIILSDENTISRVLTMAVHWDGATTEIAHWKEIVLDLMTSATEGIGLFKLRGETNKNLFYDQGYVDTTIAYFPNDLGAISSQITRAVFDESLGLHIVFSHEEPTLSIQSRRLWKIVIEQETVAR